jgi:hypothetical protein
MGNTKHNVNSIDAMTITIRSFVIPLPQPKPSNEILVIGSIIIKYDGTSNNSPLLFKDYYFILKILMRFDQHQY